MAQRVVYPEVGKKLEVGRCESHGCGSVVYATFRAENGQSPTVVSCDVGHVMGPREWLLLHHNAQAARRGVQTPTPGHSTNRQARHRHDTDEKRPTPGTDRAGCTGCRSDHGDHQTVGETREAHPLRKPSRAEYDLGEILDFIAKLPPRQAQAS